jgi:hypothetical protein
VGAALIAAVVTGLGAWSLWPGNRPAAIKTPFSVIVDCERFNMKTGRVLMKLTVTSRVAHPLRFQGHVTVAIRRILSGDNWVRYAYVSADTPLTTIRRGHTFTWSTHSHPVLLRGSTAHLELGSCVFYANPPRLS